MDDFSIFIAVAGQHKRFGDTEKCTLPVNGEPLIRRTIRLLKEKFPGVQPCILTWNTDLLFPDCEYVLTGKTRCLAETILKGKDTWHGSVYILLGDVVYTGNFIDRVFDVPGIAVFASTGNGKWYSELYTLSFDEKNYRYMEKVLINTIPLSGLQGICFTMNRLGILNRVRDYLRGENKELFGERAPWYLYWLWEWGWRKKGVLHYTGDRRVFDFDCSEEYRSYMALLNQEGFFLSEHGENMKRQKERQRIAQLKELQ